MSQNHRKLAGWLMAAMLAATQLVLAPAASASEMQEKPSAGAMFFDALAVRPVMLVGTTLGAATWLVSLPFSALGGNVGAAGDYLVMQPAHYTFVRPLGDF
jgi:hypothetical protein